MRVLVVRLGAMGDVIHALPAVAALKSVGHWVTWAIEPRWAPLLAENPNVDQIIPINRRQWSSIRQAFRSLRKDRFDCALDLQGLIKSALVCRLSAARQRIGYASHQLRERAAAWMYTSTKAVSAAHIVDQHLQLVGVRTGQVRFALPTGSKEGDLPDEFVLASPFAGWRGKEWPLSAYAELAARLPLPLVLNGHPAVADQLRQVPNVKVHISSIHGLIDATRRARAVVGVDSGPLHLAAALGKPGVAIFGPTDPARNGPYGGSIRVLRAAGAVTTYQRSEEYSASMLSITPAQVIEALSL